jgi:hypothetical protein
MEVVAPFGKTWDATIDMFATRTIQIKTLDRSSGLIVAEPQTVSEYSDFADCGSFMYAPIKPSAATWNVLVRGDSSKSTVRATVRFVSVRANPMALSAKAEPVTVDCSSNGSWETQFERAIKETAEKKK